MKAPILLLAYGNVSRGDDGLAPLLLERFDHHRSVDTLVDFQLQPEHALDIEGYKYVIFIDASVNCDAHYEIKTIGARKDRSYSSHAMSPQAVLAVYETILGKTCPPCFLLTICGYHFELGEGLSSQALDNLQQAYTHLIAFIEHLLL